MFDHYITEFTNYDENPDDSYGEGRRKILVSNIPPGVSAYELEWIFTNEKKQGGGEVVSLELNANDRTAIIEFKEIHGKSYF